MPLDKVFPSAHDALRDVRDGMTLLCGGFGLCGIPEELVLALRDLRPKQLTFVRNNAGTTKYFNIIYNNICNGFWGLDLCISINTFSKSSFLSIKPIGQI